MALAGEARGGSILQARGTLARSADIDRPEERRRIWLLVELGIVFLIAPMAIRIAIFTWHIPLPIVLQPLLLGFVVFLLWDPTFKLTRELATGISLRALVSILTIFVLSAGLISFWVMRELPHRFLVLPSNMPMLWLAIMILYPLLSVIPQELIFRTFYFHRYGPVFGDFRKLAIVTNGLLFGFAHVIYGNLVSIGLTAVLGILVAWRYDETRSFWAVWLEHSLYGCMIFTVGLGHYFFTGIASFR